MENRELSTLRVEKLRKGVGDFTLAADFEVRSGERAALIGRSGSGKTTLLRLLAGLDLLEKGEGRIFLGSDELTRLAPQRREVGLVFQDQALFPSLDVLQNVIFGLRLRKIPREKAEAEGLAWLERLGLKSRAHAPVSQLSGGESQRVAFIRALIWKPRLLLLDEPFSALDTELRGVLRTELVELHRLWPVPMVLVSHDREDLESIATVRLELMQTPDSSVRIVERVEVR